MFKTLGKWIAKTVPEQLWRFLRATIRVALPALTWFLVAPGPAGLAIVSTSVAVVAGRWIANVLPRKENHLSVTKLRWFNPKRYFFLGTAGSMSISDFGFRRAWAARRQPVQQVRLGLGETWLGMKPTTFDRTTKAGKGLAFVGTVAPLALAFLFYNQITAGTLSGIGNWVIKSPIARGIFGDSITNFAHHYLFTRGTLSNINEGSAMTLRLFPGVYAGVASFISGLAFVGTTLFNDEMSQTDLNELLIDFHPDIDLEIPTVVSNNFRTYEAIPKTLQAKVKARLNMFDGASHNLISDGVLQKGHTAQALLIRHVVRPESPQGATQQVLAIANPRISHGVASILNRKGFTFNNPSHAHEAAQAAVNSVPEIFGELASESVVFIATSKSLNDFVTKVNMSIDWVTQMDKKDPDPPKSNPPEAGPAPRPGSGGPNGPNNEPPIATVGFGSSDTKEHKPTI